MCPQAPSGEPGQSRRPRWGGADGGGVQTMRLFQNRRRKVLAPGPGARGGGRGGLGVRRGPHQHPAPPNPFCRQEGAPTGIPNPCSILGCYELLRSQPRTWQESEGFRLEQRAPRKGGVWGSGEQSRRRPSPAMSWPGLRGVAVLAFRWHRDCTGIATAQQNSSFTPHLPKKCSHLFFRRENVGSVRRRLEGGGAAAPALG